MWINLIIILELRLFDAKGKSDPKDFLTKMVVLGSGDFHPMGSQSVIKSPAKQRNP